MNINLTKFLKGISMSVAAIGLFAASSASAAELTVYTAVEADELAGFKKAFESDNPGITINWIRDSTGIVTSKLMAEKNNPKADVVWGLAATSLMLLGNEGYFQGYAPAGLDKLEPKFYDRVNKAPQWVGQRAWIASVCFNTVEGAKHNLPIPTDWQDLTKPVYKGHVIMPNPNSSGTGFLDVSSWMQMMGEEAAWTWMACMRTLHATRIQAQHLASLLHVAKQPLVYHLLIVVQNQSQKVHRLKLSHQLLALVGT